MIRDGRARDDEFTPGQWVARFDSLPSGTRLFPHVQMGDGAMLDIHCLVVNAGGTLDACDANARLIAAAPDLLEACKFVDSYFGKAFGFDCADPGCEVCEAHKLIQAAVQKAEGGE